MVKFLCSFNWNIDARLKEEYLAKPINSFVCETTQYGNIVAIDNPYDSYTKGYISMLQINLNRDAILSLIGDITFSSCKVENINFILGFCGLLTIELFGEIENPTKEYSVTSDNYKSDLISIANGLPQKVSYIDKIVGTVAKYLVIDMRYYYGQPRFIVDKNLCNASDSYIYTYHLFSNDVDDLTKFKESLKVGGESIIVENNEVWMSFANYIWRTQSEPDIELAHRLSFASIPAAWEVLVYDVGAINCKNLLKLVNQNIPFDSAIMRCMINRDNLILQEICISKREQTIEQHSLTVRSNVEFGSNERADLFFKCQDMLKYAIRGYDVKKQAKSSRVVEVILSVLTAMSVYSVVNDIYTLVTGREEVISFHFLSTLLLSIATIIMVIVLFSIIRERTE